LLPWWLIILRNSRSIDWYLHYSWSIVISLFWLHLVTLFVISRCCKCWRRHWLDMLASCINFSLYCRIRRIKFISIFLDSNSRTIPSKSWLHISRRNLPCLSSWQVSPVSLTRPICLRLLPSNIQMFHISNSILLICSCWRTWRSNLLPIATIRFVFDWAWDWHTVVTSTPLIIPFYLY